MAPGLACILPFVEQGDSELGRWISAHWKPEAASALCDIVDQIWYFDGTLALQRERVFPDGSVEIVVQLDEPHRDGDVLVPSRFPAVCINGVRTGPNVVVAPKSRCRVVGIRLHAVGADSVTGVPARLLGDATVDLCDVAGAAGRDLGERCWAAAQARAGATQRAIGVVQAAVDWVNRRVSTSATHVCAVAPLARIIVRERGTTRIETVRSSTAWTRPELARRFRAELGMGPKRFARIVRFAHALRAINGGATQSAAATDLQYFDQAHLHRDFEEFARMTPGEFLASTRYGGSPNIAEP